MLDHSEICNLIPHAGKMCLLDSVRKWDEKNIVCISTSHRNIDNPLRNEDGLPMSSLIEYGAQAMAIHGSLLAKKSGNNLVEGYLASLRDIQIANGWLSDIKNELEINAERIYAETSNMIYTMKIYSSDQLLVSGRATVVAKFNDKVLEL